MFMGANQETQSSLMLQLHMRDDTGLHLGDSPRQSQLWPSRASHELQVGRGEARPGDPGAGHCV